MAINTDNGDQEITFDYNMRARGSDFNKLLHKLLPVGLYGDMPTLGIISNNDVSITPFFAIVEDSANDLSIKVATTTNASATVSPTSPLIVARYTWVDLEDNFVDILGIPDASISDDYAVLGRCVFSGNTLTGFDLTYQQNSNTGNKVDIESNDADILALQTKTPQDYKTTDTPTFADLILTGLGNIKAMITTLNSRVNQGVNTTNSPTFASINTGQGANELYGMNQGVKTTDSPTFTNATIGGHNVDSELDTLNSRVNQGVKTTDSPTFEDIAITGMTGTVESRIEDNTTNISTNAGNISSNDGDISTLQGRVTGNDGDISTLQGRVTGNDVDITNLQNKTPQSYKTTDTITLVDLVLTGVASVKDAIIALVGWVNQGVKDTDSPTFNGVNTDNVTLKHRLYTGALANGYAIVTHGLDYTKIVDVSCVYISSGVRLRNIFPGSTNELYRIEPTTVEVHFDTSFSSDFEMIVTYIA